MATEDITPFEATHPGTVLLDEMTARSIKQTELAIELGVLPTFLNEIIKGKRPLTADFAVLLEKVFEIPADFWMRFQCQYDIDKAKLKEKNIHKIELIETWNIIKEYVPVRYFKKLGYLDNSLEENILKIKEIYKVNSIDGLVNAVAEHKTLSFYRKSDKLHIDGGNMLAWSKLAEYEAENVNLKGFTAENIDHLKFELQKIFYHNCDVKAKTQQKLSEYGIILVYLQKFDKTPIDGFSFWSKNNPAIALTLRHKRIDNFAFTVMHELGHIELHLKQEKKRQFIDIHDAKHKDIYELQADEYAQKSLMSDRQWNDLKKNSGSLNDLKIIAFGEKYTINPAIILGRICWSMKCYTIRSKIDKTLNS